MSCPTSTAPSSPRSSQHDDDAARGGSTTTTRNAHMLAVGLGVACGSPRGPCIVARVVGGWGQWAGCWGDEPSTSSMCDDGDDMGRGLGSRGTSWRCHCERRASLSPLDGLDAGQVGGSGRRWKCAFTRTAWRCRHKHRAAPLSLPPRRPRPGRQVEAIDGSGQGCASCGGVVSCRVVGARGRRGTRPECHPEREERGGVIRK